VSLRDSRVRADAAASLSERVLVATSPKRLHAVAPAVSRYREVAGVVAIGRGSTVASGRLLAMRSDMVIAFDPAAYDKSKASTESPLALSDDDSLFPASLADVVAACAEQYDAVFSPTGLIVAADSSTLEAVVATCNAVDHPALVTTLPVEQEWLAARCRHTLIGHISGCKSLVALVVVGQFDPYEDEEQFQGLVEVIETCGPKVFLHRTDMAAFQAIPRGLRAASIGATTSLRHTVPGWEHAQRHRTDHKPGLDVFVPGIDEFRNVEELDRWFGDDAPTCPTPGCCGRSLTDFDPCEADRTALAAHNARSCLVVAEEMLSLAKPDRMAWLRTYRLRVATAFDQLRAQIGVRGIKPYGSYAHWLGLDD
jgi:hypothetical protein